MKHIVSGNESSLEELRKLKDRKQFSSFRLKNIAITKQDVKDSVIADLFIVQTINTIEDCHKIINTMAKRLREWHAYYYPELLVEDHRKYAELVLEGRESSEMGADFSKKDLDPIHDLAKQVLAMFELVSKELLYLETVMQEICPNVLAITGPAIGAKLMARAGSLKRLMEMPASTVQLLGAEKALFRHMKTGARPPKHGYLHEHPLVLQAPYKMQGKIARSLADKISIAAKIDYFKGEFIGDKLLIEVKRKAV